MGEELEQQLPRCELCNVPLGESNNILFVEGQWLHYTCAFQKSITKLKGEEEVTNEISNT